MKNLLGSLGKMTRMDVSYPTVPRRRLEDRQLKGQIPSADTWQLLGRRPSTGPSTRRSSRDQAHAQGTQWFKAGTKRTLLPAGNWVEQIGKEQKQAAQELSPSLEFPVDIDNQGRADSGFPPGVLVGVGLSPGSVQCTRTQHGKTQRKGLPYTGLGRNPVTGFPGQLCLGSGMPSESEFWCFIISVKC